MFDLDQFIADCRAALAADKSHKLVRDVVARAVSDPTAVLKSLGEPTRSVFQPLHRSRDSTIANVIWAPKMTDVPHNHHTWAVISIHTGREDNICGRRVPDGRDGKLDAAAAKALWVHDAEPRGRNIIHSATNPIDRLTGAIHVYGGNFFDPAHRSEWNAETLLEQPWDPQRAVARFEDANATTTKS